MAQATEPSRSGGIGRARELAMLAFARDSARAGRGGLLSISGDAGVGKTWLCEEAATAARAEGFTVGWGAGWPAGEAPRLWPWQQPLREVCGPDAAALLGGVDVEPGDRSWFAGCVAIVDALRAATARHPALLVLDDAHIADVASLHLAQFVARHVRALPVVVIVAHRTPAAEPAGSLLSALERDGQALPLGGLGRDEVAAILAADGLAELADVDLDFVLRASRGRPLDVQRLAAAAAAADPASGVDRRSVLLHSVVERRIDDLDPAVRDLAARAALLGRTITLADLAAVRTDADPEPADLLAALRGATLAVAGEPGTLTFSHDEVVAALVRDVAPDVQVEVHARMADALATEVPTPSRLARRAEHALRAAGRSPEAARLAIDVATAAATALSGRHDHHRAADLLCRAITIHRDAGAGPAPAWLRAAHASEVLRCGHLATSRAQFEIAAEAAEAVGDIVSLAHAALGLGGVWLSEHRSSIDQQRVFAMQRRALRELDPAESTLRVRLEVRLAAERAYATGRSDRLDAAVDAARATGDPSVLAEALSLLHHTLLGPANVEARAAVAKELLSVAATAGDDLWTLMALCWATVDDFLTGDTHGARSLRELHDRAAALGCRSIEYVADVMGVMLLIRDGRFEEAEQRAAACYEVGVEVGDADALAWYGSQMIALRWMQGRAAEVLPLAADTADSPTLTQANHAFTAVAASLAADSGQPDVARAALARLRSADLYDLRRTSAWMATLFSMVEAASLLGDEATCREAAELLAPFADLPVMGSMAVVCLGSAHRSLGLAALTCGDVDAAIGELEAAVEVDDRIGNRPMAAMTRADLARALLVRGGQDDAATAGRLLDDAIREAQAIGMGARADTWRERRLAITVTDVRPPLAEPPADAGVIRRHGPSWVLSASGREVVVPDLLGMAYLAELLTRPGREIAATDLAAAGGGGGEQGWEREQPVLDEQALSAYRARIIDLEDELAEADRFADGERAARARKELDELVDELGRATGLHGRARAFATSSERARTAVRKAVARALDHIAGADPALGEALRQSVRTGRTCAYLPGPGAPARWVLAPAAQPA